MKDFNGNTVLPGDLVAYIRPGSVNGLKKGTVKKLTPQGVTIITAVGVGHNGVPYESTVSRPSKDFVLIMTGPAGVMA